MYVISLYMFIKLIKEINMEIKKEINMSKLTPVMKKMDLNGQILSNNDFGIGYTIVWQSFNSNKDDGVNMSDMLSVLINECNFIINSKYNNNKYQELKIKLEEALKEFVK